MSDKQINSTAVLVAVIATVAIGLAAALAMIMSDVPQQTKSDNVEKTNAATTQRTHVERESMLPAELTAEMNFKDGSWQANGPVKDDNLIKLTRTHKRLPSIYLNQSEITGKGIAALRGHDVVELEIIDSDIDAKMAASISQLDGLRKLFLKDNSVTDETMAALTGPATVVGLHFKGATLTSEGLKDLYKAFPKLKQLVFINCPNIDDAALAHLSKYKEIGQLAFMGTAVSPEVALQAINKLSSNTIGFRGPNAYRFIEGLKSNTKVVQIDLSGATLTDKCIDALCTLKQARTIFLRGTSGMTAARAARLHKSLPQCNIDMDPVNHSPEMGYFDAEKEKQNSH